MTEVQAPAGYAAAAGAATLGEERAAHRPRGGLAALSIGALGVVYGDIGTSPLYAVDQISPVPPRSRRRRARARRDLAGDLVDHADRRGQVRAAGHRAQNEGEGGVFALYSLLHPYIGSSGRLLLWGLMLGAGLLFGDGMITPAISVLSAVEGLNVATPASPPTSYRSPSGC